MSKKRRIVVRLKPSTYEKLEKRAQKTGNSLSSYVREGIFLLLSKKEMNDGDEDE